MTMISKDTLKALKPLLDLAASNAAKIDPACGVIYAKDNQYMVSNCELTIIYREPHELNANINGALLKAGIEQLTPYNFKPYATQCDQEYTQSVIIPITYLKHLQTSMSSDATRPYLKGVCIRENDICATDGYVVHIVNMQTGIINNQIVPNFMIDQIVKLEKIGDNVTLEFSANWVRATIGNYTLIAKLIRGTFLDIERVVPKNYDNHFYFNVESIKHHEKQFKALCKENSDQKGWIQLRDGKIICHGVSFDCPMLIGLVEYLDFNYRYLLSMPNGVCYYNGGSPIKIIGDNYTSVLMPMRCK